MSAIRKSGDPMTVRQWIAWLKEQPPESLLVLRDPDTEWYLPLLTKPVFPSNDAPANSTVVFAEYN